MKFPNGYGSVVNLGKNRRKPYAVRVTVDRILYEKDGKFHSKQKFAYLGTFATSKEAHMYLAEYNANKVDGVNVVIEKEKAKPTKIVTFAELYEEWYKRKEMSPKKYSESTFRHYRGSFNKLSNYHEKPINFFTSNEIQNILDSLNDFSEAYVVQIASVLKGVLDLAYKKKLIVKNEFDCCELYYKKTTEQMHRAFSKAEIRLLWENVDDYYVKMILIHIYTGFRPSELVEISKANVHMNESYVIEGKKTNAGINRPVPLHEKIKPLVGSFIDDAPFLFHNRQGSHIAYSTYRTHFHKTLDMLGIKGHTPHDCRHTCSTLMAEVGIPLVHRQKILGHVSGNVTDDVYVHLNLDVLIEDINKIDV